jgi:hypothetical protein
VVGTSISSPWRRCLPLWWDLRSRGICRKLPHPSLRPDGGSSECTHRNARGCRSGPVRERGPGRPMAGATASLSRQSYAQGRGRRNRNFHKGAWALTQAACSRSGPSAAQWRVGKGEIAVDRRSRGPTSDSRARQRTCDAEYFCDTNLACRRGRSGPNRVNRVTLTVGRPLPAQLNDLVNLEEAELTDAKVARSPHPRPRRLTAATRHSTGWRGPVQRPMKTKTAQNFKMTAGIHFQTRPCQVQILDRICFRQAICTWPGNCR